MTWSINALITPHGLLKVCQVVLGVLCFVLAAVYGTGPLVQVTVTIDQGEHKVDFVPVPGFMSMGKDYFAFLLIVFACLFTSILLLVSYINEESADRLKKSMFEILFHLFAFLLYLSSTIAVIVQMAKIPKEIVKHLNMAPHAFVVIFGAINSACYALNAFLGFRAARQS